MGCKSKKKKLYINTQCTLKNVFLPDFFVQLVKITSAPISCLTRRHANFAQYSNLKKLFLYLKNKLYCSFQVWVPEIKDYADTLYANVFAKSNNFAITFSLKRVKIKIWNYKQRIVILTDEKIFSWNTCYDKDTT